jgi:hypothetical protein
LFKFNYLQALLKVIYYFLSNAALDENSVPGANSSQAIYIKTDSSSISDGSYSQA